MKAHPTNTRNRFDRLTTLADYATEIPEHLNDLLLPAEQSELEQFAERIRKLRIKQEEREYVMGLQEVYDLPLRPNATVKQTMIRARLKIRLDRLAATGRLPEPGTDDLPVDPLE
jgi:hypothetical protein